MARLALGVAGIARRFLLRLERERLGRRLDPQGLGAGGLFGLGRGVRGRLLGGPTNGLGLALGGLGGALEIGGGACRLALDGPLFACGLDRRAGGASLNDGRIVDRRPRRELRERSPLRFCGGGEAVVPVGAAGGTSGRVMRRAGDGGGPFGYWGRDSKRTRPAETTIKRRF